MVGNQINSAWFIGWFWFGFKSLLCETLMLIIAP